MKGRSLNRLGLIDSKSKFNLYVSVNFHPLYWNIRIPVISPRTRKDFESSWGIGNKIRKLGND